MKTIRSLVWLLSCMVPIGADAQVALYTVGADTACSHASLQAAIISASTDDGTVTTIQVARNQSYTSLAVEAHDRNLIISGGFDSCSDFSASGKTTLNGTGGTSAPTLLMDADFERDVTLRNLAITNTEFVVRGGAVRAINAVNLNLENVSISGADTTLGAINYTPSRFQTLSIDEDSQIFSNSGGVGSRGGGIYCSRAVMLIRGSLFDNHAERGGALYANNCTVTMESKLANSTSAGNTVSLNSATQDGGAIYAISGSEITLSGVDDDPMVVSLNDAQGRGGGVYLQFSDLIATSTHILSNTATNDGGGIFADSGSKVLISSNPGHCVASGRCSRLAQNEAGGAGGGYYGQEGTMEIHSTWITENQASEGSALAGDDLDLMSLRNSILAENSGANSVVSSTFSPLDIVFTTFADNSDQTSDLRLSSGSVELRGSIFREVSAPVLTNVTIPVATLVARCLMVHDRTGLPSNTSIVEDDPQFVDASSGNYHLSRNSPAIDFCDHPEGNPGLERDIDGDFRGEDIPDVADRIGVYDLGADSFTAIVFQDRFEPPGP